MKLANKKMLHKLKDFLNFFEKPKKWLVVLNFILIVSIIFLNNLGIFPLTIGDFIFFAILFLMFSLYRPGWAFLFFIGTIPLEIINFFPENFSFAIRPYQLFGFVLTLALIVLLFAKKINLKLIKFNFADYIILFLIALNFLTVIISDEKISSLKSAIIFLSFSLFYFLVRNYVQNIQDLKKIIPFFLSSSLAIIFYGIWQNIRFMQNLTHFEVMPGRPNSVFYEPDWLGIFLALFLCAVYGLVYYFKFKNQEKKEKNKIFLFLLLSLSFLLLILTVSRSAWLGAFLATGIFFFIVFTNLKFNPRFWQWKKTLELKIFVFSAFILAISVIYVLPLTNFKLIDRARSSTGLQKITVSCEKKIDLPEKIETVEKLKDFNCRHINLEEIDAEKKDGKFVLEISRPDPNVQIRSEIYKKTWQEIGDNFLFGVGLANIKIIFGYDSAGNFLNSSNIFLEVWLGLGFFGFVAFSLLFLQIIFRGIRNYFFSQDHLIKSFNLFIIISWFAIVIANLFNSGLMLGFLWVYLAISQIKNEDKIYENRN